MLDCTLCNRIMYIDNLHTNSSRISVTYECHECGDTIDRTYGSDFIDVLNEFIDRIDAIPSQSNEDERFQFASKQDIQLLCKRIEMLEHSLSKNRRFA